ncbi:MAG: UDP-N-acetylmuramate--L-alanine ligase [Lautropia sp.]|nr:UDP-N-acetylmuramate--L-alanine ligase [Lautropia sp.]
MKHKVRQIHFVGIGGAGMSGIAEVLLNLGYRVSGSDLNRSKVLDRLAGLGARIHVGHEAEHADEADCVVVSTAVRADNPEVRRARARRVPVVPRALMLAELMKIKQGVAIAGTHGKTTTTSLVASVLAKAGLDPTFVIGGRLNSAGVNARLGSGDYIVVEADESDASFLNLSPMIAAVTNIDADHMDTYGHDMAKLKQAFVDFLNRLPFYGAAVLCIDDQHVREIVPFVSKQVLTYGLCEEAQTRAVDVRAEGERMRFTVLREGENPLDVSLALSGEHNVRNALAAIVMATELGVEDEAIVSALAEFRGVGRRFERYGDLPVPSAEAATEAASVSVVAPESRPVGSVRSQLPDSFRLPRLFTLIDDYGHHPVEIEATIAAVRGAYPGRRLVLAFQPHRYSRTRDLFEDFVRVLCQADQVVLTEVYAAGEPPIVAADGRALVRAVRLASRHDPLFVAGIDELPAAVLGLVQPGDVVVTMGAGSIGTTAARIVEMAQGAALSAEGGKHV